MTNKYENAMHVSRETVRFYDTDLSGVVFFANYIKWFDSIAIIEFFTQRGLNWKMLKKMNVDIVMVNVNFDFVKSLTLDDIVEIAVDDVALGSKSLTITGTLYDGKNGSVVSKGTAVYVFVANDTRESVAIPGSIRELLE